MVVRVMKCAGEVLIGIISVVGMMFLVGLAAFSVFAACIGLAAALTDNNFWLGIGCGLYIMVALIAFLRAST